MEFLVVGLNHRTAPVEVRERLSLNKEQLPEALSAMKNHGASGVILSTCNRSEFYTLELPEDLSAEGPKDGADRVKEFLVERFGISLLDVDRYLYVYRGYDCIHHLFRVASSLDSMILGEEQIIGQVRDAYETAPPPELFKALSPSYFNRLYGSAEGCAAKPVSAGTPSL